MGTIFEYMTKKHRHCDELFANAENLANKSKWSELSSVFQEFVTETEDHLRKEEDVLFPGVEQATGSTGGPTQVMRLEHEQMRKLIDTLSSVIARQNRSDFLGESETLMILIQQHNMKEEQILYPMIDRILGENSASYIREMEQN